MEKPSIAYFGTPDYSATVLEALHQAGFPIKAAVTTPDAPVRRNKAIMPTPVKLFAQAHEIPVFTPKQLRENQDLFNALHKLTPDLFIVFSYGKIIPLALLNLPKCKALNIHPSLLPKYRGPSPIQAQILDGVTLSGISVIEMTQAVDAGPIVAQESVTLHTDITFAEASSLHAAKAAEILPNIIIDYVAKNIIPKNQHDQNASYTKIISKDDGYVPLESLQSMPAEQVDRMVRAYYPWPSVWTKFDAKTLKFLPKGVVQLEGKSPIPLRQLLNGYPALKPFITHLL